MKYLKDVAQLNLNDKAIETVVAKFAKGEQTQQEAFALLVGANVKALNRFVEKKANGVERLIRGAQARLRKLLEASALKSTGLATSYIIPSCQLARATIEGDGSEAYKYVIENLTEEMDPNKGDIAKAAMFTPSRLAAGGKEFAKKDGSKFEVATDADGDKELLLNGRRFGSYTIEDIKMAIRTGSTDPEALDVLTQFLGLDEEDTANGKEKKGTLGSFIAKVRKDFAGTEGNDFALECAEALETTMFKLRDELTGEHEVNAAKKKAEAQMKKEARRLARQAKVGVERDEAELTAESYTEGAVNDG